MKGSGGNEEHVSLPHRPRLLIDHRASGTRSEEEDLVCCRVRFLADFLARKEIHGHELRLFPGIENPSEEFGPITQGIDYGWPYCYYDPRNHRKVQTPEYGGDGNKTGRCDKVQPAVAAYPGHWAPMALAFSRGSALGAAYAEGAFIAFHGSWNRAPLPQAGYRVVFQPFHDGKPVGEARTVAQGAESDTSLRAAGVALGGDGALYISADQNGRVWRVVRK